MLKSRRLPWMLFLLTACLCQAEVQQSPDFTSGLKQLTALGLPGLPEGTQWTAPDSKVSANYQIDQRISKRMKGGIWVLPDAPDGTQRRLAVGTIRIQETAPPSEKDGDAKSGGLLGRVLGREDDKPKAAPEVDLAKDVATLCSAVEKLENFDDADDFRASWSSHGARSFGPLLIFAAQLEQTGHADLANQLATALFRKAPNREIVVDAAVNSIAEQLYEDATARFFKGHDWELYHKELQALVAKFSRGWDNQAAVGMMIEALAARAAGEPPPVPKLDGVEIEARALDSVAWMREDPSPNATESKISPEIAAQLAQLPAQYRAEYLQQIGRQDDDSIQQVGTWLLKTQDELKQSAGPALPTLSLGVAALPVLAALADDTYLIARRNSHGQRSTYFSSSSGPYERAIQAYATMNRPATRGDLASFLLSATLPDSGEEIRNADTAALRDMALEFWEQHRNDSQAEIAIAFLADGSGEQKQEAARVLASSKDPAHHKALEDHILADPSPLGQLMAVFAYVQLRKADAKPFYDRYVIGLKEEVGDGSGLEEMRNLSWELRDKSRVDTYIKQLDSLTAGKSPQAMAREIASGTVDEARTAVPALMESLSDKEPRHQLFALLSGALAADDAEVRSLFLNQTFQVPWLPEDADEEELPEETPDRKYSENEAKAWRKLIGDDRKLPDSLSRYSNNTGDTLGKMAALAFEYSVQSSVFEKLREAVIITGKDIGTLANERADARLAGNPIPPLPDPSKVSSTRLAEIVSTASTKSPTELHPFLNTLNFDERAAWLKWMAEPGDPAIPESVMNARAFIIKRLPEYYGMTDMPDVFGVEVGTEFSEATVKSWVGGSAANLDGQSRSLSIITRSEFAPGLAVFAMRMDLPKKKPEEDESPIAQSVSISDAFRNLIQLLESDKPPENAEGVISFRIYAGRTPTNLLWWVIDGKPKLFQPDPDDDEDPDNEESDGAATWPAELRKSDDRLQVQIQVLSRADATAIIESTKEADALPELPN